MNKHHDLHFNKDIITIYPGEFYSSPGPELISTVLGSCISIALFDLPHEIGGMNHFMLAKDCCLKSTTSDNAMGRFGEYAIELLVNDLMKKGAARKNLTAKIFGGSNVFGLPPEMGAQIGSVNIEFAFDYLQTEQIPVISSDTGGIFPRKIVFEPKTSKVWLKRINTAMSDNSFIISEETEYLEKLRRQQAAADSVIWL
jgi:chemotaxis protein CheD